jgi:RNA polymerase sigma-70 factor (ECF subfamily)
VRQSDQEPHGFEELAMPLFASLYNFAHWLTHDRTEAEDLVQETFAKALRGFPSFQPQTNFRAWMFRILKNTFLTSRAGLRAHPTVSLAPDDEGDVDAVATDTPESILIGRASRELVRGAIEALSPPFREAVILRDVEGLTYLEIAEALAIPIGTVMSRLARGRRDIRKQIEKKLGGK